MKYDNEEEIRARMESIRWAHPIDLGQGVITREWHVRRRFRRRLNLLQIPESLKGWTVLDIGACDGFFSFECERRGADTVLAIDTYHWDTVGNAAFLASREILDSQVEHRRMDVHNINPEEIGKFDLVLFFGVFYHLRNPLLALENIASVTKRLVVCETHVLLPFLHEKYPLIPFFPGDELAEEGKYELCAMPTLECLRQMFVAAGFQKIDVKYTPSFKYWKKFLALLLNRPQSGRGILHACP